MMSIPVWHWPQGLGLHFSSDQQLGVGPGSKGLHLYWGSGRNGDDRRPRLRWPKGGQISTGCTLLFSLPGCTPSQSQAGRTIILYKILAKAHCNHKSSRSASRANEPDYFLACLGWGLGRLTCWINQSTTHKPMCQLHVTATSTYWPSQVLLI